MNAVELKQVSVKYQGTEEAALCQLDLIIPHGQVVALCGESGCGKTTVTRVINGLFPRFYEGTLSGRVMLYGRDAGRMPTYEGAKLISSVFQDPRSQFYTTTTTEEVAFGAENLAVGTDKVRERVNRIFQEKGLRHLKDRSIFQLSSGEKQKIAIASVQAMEPEIYVFDEPSANLDMAATKELAATIDGLKKLGKTVIISEHRLYYLADLIDRLIIIQNGAIVSDLTEGSWYELDEAQRRKYGLRSFTLEQVSDYVQDEGIKAASVWREPSVRLENLYTGYKGRPLLRDISLQFYPGEIIGIVGKNGVGKTTFARTICGLKQSISGNIYLNGRKRRGKKYRNAECGLVMQDADYQLFAESAREELLVGLKDTEAARENADIILERLGISHLAEKHPQALSGGQKQRLTIGACIAGDGDIIFMDEPTSGLDGRNMEGLCNILKELAARGKTIFVISHDYEFLIRSSTRILSFGGTEKVEDFALVAATYSRLLNILLEKGSHNMEKEKKNRAGLGYLLGLAEGSRMLLGFSAFFSVLSGLCGFIPYVMVYRVLMFLFSGGGDLQEALRYGLISAAAIVLKFLFQIAALGLSHFGAFNTLYSVRAAISRHIAKINLGFFSDHTYGEIKKVIIEDVERIEKFLAHQIPDVVAAVVVPAAVFVYLFTINVVMALATLTPLILGFIIMGITMKVNGPQMAPYQKLLERLNSTIMQFINGMPVMKVFNLTAGSYKEYADTVMQYNAFWRRATKLQGYPYGILVALIESSLLFILPVGGMLYLNGRLSAENFIFFMIMGLVFLTGLLNLVNFAQIFTQITGGVMRIKGIMNIPEGLSGSAKLPQDITSGLRFENVSFAYKEDKVLHSLNIDLPAGSLTAFVGASGAGKTTAAQLIAKFWEVTEGEISIDGVNINDLPAEKLMDMISFVFQETFMLNDTIYENIAIGKEGTTQEAVESAARAAQIHDFIVKLPVGYQTQIGEGGVKLSGGERQRICIARAILKDAPIVVFDEATSFTDIENEHKIQLALSSLLKNKTTVMIAHRLHTIINANQICVFDKGKIVERGTHEALLEQKGLYSRMWKTYTQSNPQSYQEVLT